MDKIWWEKVPNALAFTTDIVDAVREERSVILSYSGSIPWYSYMEELIRELVKQQNSSKSFEIISGVSDPGAYLLRKFCKEEKRTAYRPTRSYAWFLAESDDIVLHERYLWVKTNSREELEAWSCFAAEYIKERGRDRGSAVFLLECQNSRPVHAKKGIKICSLDEYVGDYDRFVFCTLASSSVRERPFIRQYLTELAAQTVKEDMELCAACLEHNQDFMKDPYACIRQITESEYRSDGEAYAFYTTANEVKHRIWLAQIKTVYPVLEEYRESFVARYESAIRRELPVTSGFGEQYEEPEDVELGTLRYMAANGKLSLDMKESERLVRYHEARNRLSHLGILTLEEIRKLEA